MRRVLLGVLAAALVLPSAVVAAPPPADILNVSYDPTRELYRDVDAAFARDWKAKTGQDVKVRQSHGGSGAQSRAVAEGLPADVVTLALASDIDVLATKANLLPATWQSRLPNRSTPFYSTIVLLVRKGNPKNIRDWNDLVRPDVKVITPNPKTSGGARWNYLAAWGYARKTYGSDAKAREFMTKLFHNVPVLDSGARGSTTTFVERGQGDVLIAWENEAFLAVNQLGKGAFQLVTPSVSIRAEPPVALVDKVADQHGTRKVAEAYLRFLYTPAAQEIAAKNYYRPIDRVVAARHTAQFPHIPLFTVDKNFGGWTRVQQTHFRDGGVFDKIFEAAKG